MPKAWLNYCQQSCYHVESSVNAMHYVSVAKKSITKEHENATKIICGQWTSKF